MTVTCSTPAPTPSSSCSSRKSETRGRLIREPSPSLERTSSMFLDDNKVVAEAPTATGTTTINSAVYDMSGFEEITFIVRLGSPAANNNIRAQQDTAVGMGGAADLKDTLVNSSTLNQHMLTIRRPLEQFVRCQVTRGTTTTIDSMVVIQSRARRLPTVQSTAIVSEQYSSPIEGTA